MRSQLYLLLFVLCSISLTGYGVKPNVILIITDDQGYGDIGAHGNSMIRTPNLDRLHAQSLRLTDFHVEPCCSPTRAALMTGRTPLHNGAWATSWGRSIPRKQHLMMPAVFADNGYRTGFFGKWHLGDSYPFRPQDRGFQEVLMHGGGGVGQTPDYWGNDYFDDSYFRNGVPEQHRGYCTDVWFREAATFIASNRQQPFFVYLSTNAPHGPLIVAEKYSAPYLKKGVPAAMAKFYGMIENIDENIGRLLQNLDDWELANNTIVIFMTDNGTANGVSTTGKWRGFNAGMTGKKSAYHDGGHRVPFFLRWPAGDMQGGRDIDTLAAHVDVMPTLIDICGLEQSPATFDGKSLLPLLAGKSKVWPDRTLFVQYRRSADPPLKWEAAVLTQRWRMLNGSQLYDIRKDPGQKTNIAAQHPEVIKRLRSQYESWWDELQPTLATPARFILGSPHKNPVHLNAFDWHSSTPWNQGHIQRGTTLNGHWTVDVATAGSYQIELRRWPREVSAPIAGITTKPSTARGASSHAIPATKVRLTIGDVDQTQVISPETVAATFHVALPVGPARLQSWLIDGQGKALCGAYYASVELIAD